MCWEEDNWDIAVFLDFSKLFKHLHIDVDLLKHILEDFVDSPRHRPHN